MIGHLLTRTVTIDDRDQTGLDAEEAPVYEWVTLAADAPAEIQQTSVNEVTSGDRDTSVGQWNLWLAPSTPITPTSRVTDDTGQVFYVYGQPSKRWNPRSKQWGHVEARLVSEPSG